MSTEEPNQLAQFVAYMERKRACVLRRSPNQSSPEKEMDQAAAAVLADLIRAAGDPLIYTDLSRPSGQGFSL